MKKGRFCRGCSLLRVKPGRVEKSDNEGLYDWVDNYTCGFLCNGRDRRNSCKTRGKRFARNTYDFFEW